MDHKKCQNTDLFIKLLSIFVFIGLLGAVKPVLFNDGSAMAKYLSKQKQLEMVQEANIEQYMESALFGDGDISLETNDTFYTTDERHEAVNTIYKYDFYIATILILLSLLLFFPKLFERKHLYYFLIPIALWLFCQSVASMLNGGKKYSELAIFAHATRWGLPLVLCMAYYLKKRGKDFLQNKLIILSAVLCSSLTFAVHGWEAFHLNAPFQDLLYSFFSIIGMNISESTNFTILKIVGCMDLLLAAAILIFRNPKIFLWMAFWGLITAFSRPLTIGFDAWPEFAMRIANCALPLGLFLIFRNQNQVVLEPESNTQKMEIICE